jgi:signal transduction histidine kinase
MIALNLLNHLTSKLPLMSKSHSCKKRIGELQIRKANVTAISGYSAVRIFPLFFLLLAAYYPSFGHKSDSLRNALNNKQINDTTRVNIYAAISWEIKNHGGEVDSILFYANKGYAIANAIGFEKGKALCGMHIGMANILRNEYDTALANLNGALTYFEPLPSSGKELNEIYHNMGLDYYMQTKFEPALQYFEKSKQAATAIKNNSRLARAHYYLADIYNDMGNFPDALKNYLKALELYEHGGKQNAAANCLTNIATLYAQLKEFDKAREFVNRSLVFFSHSSNVQEIYQNYANIGIVYSMMAEYDSALQMFNRGMALSDSVGDQYWNTVFLTNIAEVYTSSDKPELALAAYRQVLQRNEEAQEVNFKLAAHSGMGRILYKQGNKTEGIGHMMAAFRLMKENRMKRLVMETALEISEMLEREGNYNKALEFTRIYTTYRDSIYNENNDKKLQQLQYDYELEKKQRQIEQLKKNKEIQKEKVAKQKVVSWSLAAAMLFSFIIILLLIRGRLIEKRNREEILKQKEEVRQQATKLEELNNFKDKTFSVLSHDLRGPINSITATVQMLINKEISGEDFVNLKPEINKELNSLNLLLDNILYWAKSYISDDKTLHPTKTNLKDLAQQNISMLGETAGRKNISITNNIDSSLYAMCDAGQMEIVLRNLVMNAIKYTGKGGSITIDGKSEGSNVTFSVQDTGVGISKELLSDLFLAKPGRNTYGTDGETGIGIGLLLCLEFVKANNGTLTATSQPGKGSTFFITLPMA